MKIPAGKLRNLVTIQQRVAGQDAGGEPLNQWTAWQQAWARIVSVSGMEQFRGIQFSPETTHQVFMRWLDGITPMHRILTDEGKILDILAVNYAERRMDDQVILTCKERITQSGSLDMG